MKPRSSLSSLVLRHVALLAALAPCVSFPSRLVEREPSVTVTYHPGPLGSGVWRVPCVLGPVRTTCMLDTGAARTWSPAFDLLAWLPTKGPVTRAGIDGRAESCHRVEVGRRGLADDPDGHGPLVVCPPREGAEPTLGIDVLGRRPFAFDAGAGRWRYLTREEAASAPAHGANAHALTVLPRGLLALDMRFGAAGHESTAPAIFDTGAGLSVVDSTFLSESRASFEDLGPIDVGTSTGTAVPMRLVRVEAIGITDRVFEDVVFLSTDLSPLRSALGAPVQAILGANLIHGSCWTLLPSAGRFSTTACPAEDTGTP